MHGRVSCCYSISNDGIDGTNKHTNVKTYLNTMIFSGGGGDAKAFAELFDKNNVIPFGFSMHVMKQHIEIYQK